MRRADAAGKAVCNWRGVSVAAVIVVVWALAGGALVWDIVRAHHL